MPLPAAALAALIGGGSSLLGSIFSGIGKQSELKQQQKTWKEQRSTRLSDINKYMRPDLPRYSMERDMPSIDPAFKKIILGRLTDLLGGERLSKWGVDPTALLGSIGQGGGVSPKLGMPGGIRELVPQQIMQKYGMDFGGGLQGKRTLEE